MIKVYYVRHLGSYYYECYHQGMKMAGGINLSADETLKAAYRRFGEDKPALIYPKAGGC